VKQRFGGTCERATASFCTTTIATMSLRAIQGLRWSLNGRALHLTAARKRTTTSPYFRCFARTARDEDQGKIPAHLASFTLLLLPCIAYAAVFYNGMDERNNELEEKIRSRYGDKVQVATTKNQAMADFYQQAILNAESGTQDDRLKQVLYGGKGEKKRFHAIDKELYGTHQGVEEKKKVEKELALERERRRERRRIRKEKRKAALAAAVAAEGESTGESDTEKNARKTTSFGALVNHQSAVVISVAAVGAIAAGFFWGGHSRR
jgi:hypothetical protein